jgi:SAM-dependent methyltransferase
MSATAGSSYDEIPYEGHALYLTYPDHLAALARLFEVSAPGVETCRVLELGCALGHNLIPTAVSLPSAHFNGIDLSARLAVLGQETIDSLGLATIELREQNILDLGQDLGVVDYILAHGVFSWVPDAVREKMLCICREFLPPNGLAFIRDNTYPGWHMHTVARDMMMYRTRKRPRFPGARALSAQVPKDWADLMPQPSVEDFPAVLRYDHHVVLALPPHMGLVLPFVHKLLLHAPRGLPGRRSLCHCTPDRSKLFGSHGHRPWV